MACHTHVIAEKKLRDEVKSFTSNTFALKLKRPRTSVRSYLLTLKPVTMRLRMTP